MFHPVEPISRTPEYADENNEMTAVIKIIMLLFLVALSAAGCGRNEMHSFDFPADPSTLPATPPPVDPFAAITVPGDSVMVTAGTVNFSMVFTGEQTGIVFPRGETDNSTTTLTTNVFLAETEATNSLVAEILQWAYDNGRFSALVSDHNGLDSTTAKHGGQQLINLSGAECRINFAAGLFTVDPGYEDHPAVFVTWYGAVMLCNWLTEMQDGHAGNLVYGGITTTWVHTATLENPSQSGYRLPGSFEWEYAARYLGQTAPSVGNLAVEYVSLGHNDGLIPGLLTAGYYWTPGDYASGATSDNDNTTATGAVAWYNGVPPAGSLRAVALKTANYLGLYDMCGNVQEWCFTLSGPNRVLRGGQWMSNVDGDALMVGLSVAAGTPTASYNYIGFRFAKSQP